MHIQLSWEEHRPRFHKDLFFILLALGIHAPLTMMKFATTTPAENTPQSRLVAVDYLEELKKPEPPPAALERVEPEKKDIFNKLKNIFSKQEKPKPAKQLEAKTPEPLPQALQEAQKRLMAKENFAAAPSQNLALKGAAPALKGAAQMAAPIGAFKSEPRAASALSSKGVFQVSQAKLPQAIGGSGISVGQAAAPTVAIPTGANARKEAFTAPPIKAMQNRFNSQAGAGSTALGASGSKGLSTGGATTAPLPVGGSSDAAPAPSAVLSSKRFGGSGASLPGAASQSGKLSGSPAGLRAAPSSSPFQIMGVLAGRAIQSKQLPVYPSWAQERGLEGAVTVEFTVTPSGTVKENMAVRRTSGYPDLDKLVMDALRKWRFAPSSDGASRDEIGTITFVFSLR